MPATGTVEAKVEATVYIKDLDIFICVKLEEDSPAVSSLGLFCETTGYFYFLEGMRATVIDQTRS